MATIWKLRGRLTEFGESEHTSTRDGRRIIYIARYDFIDVQDHNGMTHRLTGAMFLGDAATHQLVVDDELELLFSGAVPSSKKDSFGNKSAVTVYGMRVVGHTDWLGADVADISGAMAWELWKSAVLMGVLTPIAAFATFFVGGLGGLFAAWHCIKAIRGALKLASVHDVRQALSDAQEQADLEPNVELPAPSAASDMDLLAPRQEMAPA